MTITMTGHLTIAEAVERTLLIRGASGATLI